MRVAGTTPYPWPFDDFLEIAGCALVVCGSGPEWSGRCPHDADVEANIERLRDLAASRSMLVVLLRHENPNGRQAATPHPAFCRLEPRPNERVITAAGIDGFYGSSLDAVLHRAGISRLFLAGHGFETAVHSTLRRANDRGYECLTVADACAVLDEACRAASISTIEMSGGIFGAVGTTASVIRALALPEPEVHS